MHTFFRGKLKLTRRRLRFALLFGTLLILVLILIAASFTVYHKLVKREEQQFDNTLNHIADTRTAAVSAWIMERMGDAAVFGNGRFLGETLNAWIARGSPDDDTKRQVREQLNAIKAAYSYIEVAILDTDGNVRITTRESAQPLDPVAVQTVRRAIAVKGTQVSPIHSIPGATEAERVIDLATPLLVAAPATPAQENISSILLLRADANLPLEPFVRPLPLIDAASEVIMAEVRDGQVFVSSLSEPTTHFRYNSLLPITPSQLLAAASQPGSRFLLEKDIDGRLVAVARNISGTPWYLISMIKENAIRDNVHHLAWLVAGISSGVLILLGTVALGWWRKRETEIRLQTLQARAEAQFLQHQYDHLSRQSEAALRESQEKLNGILESILDVVWSFSADFTRLNYINRSAENIYGYPMSAFLERPALWFEAIHPQDREKTDRIRSMLDSRHASCEAEYRIIRSDGQIRWMRSRCHLVMDAEGHPLRIDGVSTDITQRKATEQQVETLAYYDNVTGLANRSLLNDRLAQATHMAQRSQRKIALLFMDLDNFKNINDSLGHHIGDILLRAVAERLQQCVREEDTVARIGGDEFLVVLPDIAKAEQAAAVAEKILAAIATPFLLQDQQIRTTTSIGISIFPEDGHDEHELIRHADSALYQAKEQGRNNYRFFTPELNRQIIRSSSIERQLRHAIDAGELSLWYQPQVDAASGKVIGAEALMRWRQKGRDFLPPVEFIPIAEERGLINKIGEWALREACMQCRRWQSEGLRAIPISVNVSPLQFQQKNFSDLVTGLLEETRLGPGRLALEIKESAIMLRAPLVAELVARLREVGVKISIDDFGIGYSNLSYLRQLPIDKIKIDRSLITDILHDPDDEAITHAIINLAHSLNLRVLAEGVESKTQLERLRLFGCNEVQGNYYSSAVPADTLHAFLTEERSFAAAT